MESLKELYRIGRGPSSSHTMGPEAACKHMKEVYPAAHRFEVTLFGSLAKTGKGHGTDDVIRQTFQPAWCEVFFDEEEKGISHPNTFLLKAFSEDGALLGELTAVSVGGGKVTYAGEGQTSPRKVYQHASMEEIARYCKEKALTLTDYVYEQEGDALREYLRIVWKQMNLAIDGGLQKDGVLPGGLNLSRKASLLFKEQRGSTAQDDLFCRIYAYAYATAEENAAGETVVTAPTCGSSGVLPAVLRYAKETEGYSDDEIADALAVAGLIGNLVKENASISGAECGCQAEIGTACAMAAGAIGTLRKFSIRQIDCAAEIAMEHSLGLTCDPVHGLVQIPCIERNAVSALRAISSCALARHLAPTAKVSFDTVVKTMYETGINLSSKYRETAEGGLATALAHLKTDY